jgi:dolichol-phosphate mannosyltransferase
MLSRNFGQHYAITAGLDQVYGTWTVVMDCDLQDRPEEIPSLYRKPTEGFDVVFGQRVARQDTIFKRLSSKFFYGVLNYLSDANHDAQTANFGIFHRRVIDVIRDIPEHNRCFPLQVKWAGFKRASIEVQHDARTGGRSSYSLRKLLKLAVDITLSYSDKPLRLSAYLGFFFSFAAMAYAAITLVRYFLGEVQILGYTSLIISIWLLGGLLLFCLGVTGLYIGRIYESAKGRPVYIVSATTENPAKHIK